MTEPYPLESFVAKLNRADHHLRDLRTAIRKFGASDFYESVTELDYRGRLVERARNVQRPGQDISDTLADCVNNYRAALDHLVWQLVILSGNKPSRDNQFPCALTGTRYWCAKKDGTQSVRDRMLRGVSDEHRAAIDAVQPYRTSHPRDTALAVLVDLSNTDKHQVINTAFVSTVEPTAENFTVFSSDPTAYVEVDMRVGLLDEDAEVMSDPDRHQRSERERANEGRPSRRNRLW